MNKNNILNGHVTLFSVSFQYIIFLILLINHVKTINNKYMLIQMRCYFEYILR